MDDTSASKPGMELEAIRARLRERGYLGGVSGWVATPRAGGWVRYAAASSLRTAVVGGPLLALPAAAAIALANRPHLSAPRDLLVLWIYLSLVLGVVLALLEFATDLILAAAARSGLVLVGRAERLAGRAGLLFTAATTLYLAFLLRGGRAGSAAEGPLAWLAWSAALVAALGIGHLVGRLTRVGSLVAILASGGSAAAVQADVRSAARRRTVALVAGLALLVAGGAVIFSSGSQRREETTGNGTRALSPLPARPTPGRIVVIGVDGLAQTTFEEAASDAARHPSLARLDQEGAIFPLVRGTGEIPPSVWTSIATGRPASEHGVLAFSAEHLWGLSAPVQPASMSGGGLGLSLRMLWPPMHSRPGPVDAMLRRVPAVWEILEAAGVKSASINWWASWPALEGGGTVVSDRALLKLLVGAPLDRDVWPTDLQRNLEEAFDQTRAAVAETVEGMESEGPLGKRAAVADAWHALVARRILSQEDPPRVVLLYLPGLDIVRGGPGGGAQAESAWLLSHLDGLVGTVMKSAGAEDLLLLVGDPGRRAPEHRSQVEGVLVAWGEGASTSRVLPGHGPGHPLLDVAPTLLALAGIPLAMDLVGKPILGFLRPGDPAAQPGGTVATYGELSDVPGQKGDPMDDEVLDRLRSLGYIR